MWEPAKSQSVFFDGLGGDTEGTQFLHLRRNHEILSLHVPTTYFFHEPIIPFMVPYTCLVAAFCANMAYQSISSFVRLVLLKIISILLGSGGPQGSFGGPFHSSSPNLQISGIFRSSSPCHRPTSSSSWCKILLEFCSSWHDILTVTSYDLLSYLHSWC